MNYSPAVLACMQQGCGHLTIGNEDPAHDQEAKIDVTIDIAIDMKVKGDSMSFHQDAEGRGDLMRSSRIPYLMRKILEGETEEGEKNGIEKGPDPLALGWHVIGIDHGGVFLGAMKTLIIFLLDQIKEYMRGNQFQIAQNQTKQLIIQNIDKNHKEVIIIKESLIPDPDHQPQ